MPPQLSLREQECDLQKHVLRAETALILTIANVHVPTRPTHAPCMLAKYRLKSKQSAGSEGWDQPICCRVYAVGLAPQHSSYRKRL